jgi:galactokinase/mevalonate kinase-like predicted kinase
MVARNFVASAPGRCGIVGNPSDIYGGFVVSCSIEARATCRLTLGEETSLPEDTRLWDAATARFPLGEPARVVWETDVPRSSGLSGSTALLAATLACVLAARGEEPDLGSPQGKVVFAELVRDIERHEAGVLCGYQDAYMIVHGGLNAMSFAGKHPARPGPVGVVKPLKLSSLPFLLVTTGVQRLSGSVHGPIVDRWTDREPLVVETIDRITELGHLGAEAIVQEDWSQLAPLMNENQRLIASVGGSGESIDRLVLDCLENGAMAAKLAGAGLGGTVIALTENPDELEIRLRNKGYARFQRPRHQDGVRME